MAHILSIITNPDRTLDEGETRRRLGALFGDRDIVALRQGVAYELALETADASILTAARGAFSDLPADVNLLPAEGRRKKLLIADMDSTIIEQECIDELAEFAGKRAEIASITERAMRGELDFEGALKERVAMLEGLEEGVLNEAFATRVTITPGAKTLVAAMNNLGAMTALVSGGFTFFTERVSAAVGFQFNQANELCIAEGRLTGKVAEPILGRAAKQDALLRLAADRGLELYETMAVGDGANDLSMLGRAGLGVAFHAKPAVAESAHARIDHGDLTALLYLQGLKAEEFQA